MRPTLRGILLLSAGTALAILPAAVSLRLWPLWVGFWGATLLAAGLDAMAMPAARRLRWSIDAPATVGVGAEADATVRVEAGGVTLRLAVHLDLSDSLTPMAAPLRLAPSDAVEVRVPLGPRRRGQGTIDALWLAMRGPLGLVVRVVRLPVDRPVEVTPDVQAARATAVSLAGRRDTRAGLRIERHVGDGTEFDSLRDFQAGFDSRAIDWKASARHTRLLARQHKAERDRQIVLAVDTGRLMAEPIAGMARLDHAIHAALVLAYLGVRAGDRVGLYGFDARPGPLVEPRGGMAGFRAALHGTAALAYTAAETNFTLGLTTLLTRLHRRSLVVVFTDFVDPLTAELMVENLRRVSLRHVVVFVALRDPLLAALRDEPPRAAIDVGRAVVADVLLRDRDVVVRRLQRHGVLCVDAPPASVGPELIDRYLRVKRRELVG